jgi:hypothetical protein
MRRENSPGIHCRCRVGDFGDFGTMFGELGQVEGMFELCGCSWMLFS